MKMYGQKLCLSTNDTFGLSDKEQILLFKKTGFEGFFTMWYPGYDEGVAECAALARNEGMIYQSLHAPWNYCGDMWDENEKEDAQKGVEQYKHCIDVCAKNDIPILVSHVFVGFDVPYVPTEFGLENFSKVIEHAEKAGVKIAFENTEGEQYLDAVLSNFRNSDAVGFCWDTGHQMCYNFSHNLMDKYSDLLIATHLNDNLGVKDYSGKITWHDDLHLLPFDGIADWQDITSRIKKSGYSGILTFELNNKSKPNRHENDKYFKMPVEEYVAECYVRACKVANLCK